MALRSTLLLGSLLCMVLGGTSRAQEARPHPAAAPAQLERRLAELEGQVSRLQKEVQALRGEPARGAAQPAAGTESRIIALRYAEAAGTAEALTDLLRGHPTAPRIVTDPRSNSLVVSGTADRVRAVAVVISLMDSRPTAR